jgi:hypothetical protein
MRRLSHRSVAILFCGLCAIGFSGPAYGLGTYEILHDTLSATGWFGGDDRPGSQRNVGIGQSVRIDTAITLTDFSFYFASRFDYAQNPDGFGHDVTLILNIRDSSGTILQTESVFVPGSFENGWVTWSGIDRKVDEGTLLIFTAYLEGGYDLHQYTSSNGADQYQLYVPGARYGKDGTTDMSMEDWTDWGQHPSWDSMFWLQGTIQTVDVGEGSASLPAEYALYPPYPNPFNPATTLQFAVPTGTGQLSLRLYDLVGQEVAVLAHQTFEPGFHAVRWEASGMPAGVYFARLSAESHTHTQKLLLLK